MSASSEQERRSGSHRDAALLFGMFGGALAWSGHLAGVYFLAQIVCGTGSHWVLYLVSAVALAIAAAALAFSWRGYRIRGEGNGFRSRVQFMGLYGTLGNLLFIFGIIMGTLPVLLLDGCGGHL